MAYTTDAALLADIRDEIQARIIGKPVEYRIADISLRRCTLKELLAMEKSLLAKTTSGVALATFRRHV